MRRLLPLILFCSVTLQAQQVVRIGAWNIEWLGFAQNRGAGNKDVPQKPSDIADYIIRSKVDVLGLEEITRTGPGDMNETLIKAFDIVGKRTGQVWRHVLFNKRNGDLNQRIGVAWNTEKARIVGNPFRIDVPADTPAGGTIWERNPHAVQFRFGAGKTDAVIIVLHQKSNRDSNPPPKTKRREEARTLVDQLDKIRDHFDDRDIILIGDTNFLDDKEDAPTMYRNAGFRDLNAEDEGTHIGEGKAPFDRTFVPKNEPEFAGVDQQVFDKEYMKPKKISSKTFRRRLSDHFMVITPVKILTDDD